MYKIDWNKYLSVERYRESTLKVGQHKDTDLIDRRNPFESDLGRVSFSSALRRMHDKTQVLPLSSGDNVHTRLTHSIEVMSIAYSLGINLCRDKEFLSLYETDYSIELERRIPIILKTAAFVHDIGNPPFGHFGEETIQQFFNDYFAKEGKSLDLSEDQKLDFTLFDGNAEGFRILTKMQYLGELSGLNLTYATLGAYCKYPNFEKIDKTYIGSKKHGIFTTEMDVFEGMVDACNLRREDGSIKRHPLSFLTEAADSISYAVMDIEDGFSLGWYTFDEVYNFISKEIGTDLAQFLDRKNMFEDGYDDRKKMCNLRISLIAYLVSLASNRFKENLESIDKGTFSEELLEKDKIYKSLENFAVKYIFPQRQVEQVELTGYSVLSQLLNLMIQFSNNNNEKIRKHLKSVISKTFFRISMHEKENPNQWKIYKNYDADLIMKADFKDFSNYAKLRMIVDLISGMTDKYAVTIYQKLSGQKL